MDGISTSGRVRRLARRASVVGAVAGVVGLLGALAPTAASAAGCGTAPAGQLFFNGTLSEGKLAIGSRAKAEGVSGSVSCGDLEVFTLHYTISQSGVKYNPFTLKLLGFLPLEGGITVDGTTEGSLSPVSNSAEEVVGYNTSFTTPITTTVSFFGIFKCADGPISVTLTTGKSGSLEGHYLEGSIGTGLAGTLVANEFSVPAIQSSSSCPGLLAFLSNFILGLPAKPGYASLTTHAELKPEA